MSYSVPRAGRASRTPLRHLVAALAAAGVLPTIAFAQEAAQPAASAESATLPAVTVHADASADQLPAPYAGGQVARGGRLGVLGNQDFMDVPFSVTSYTSQQIQNQQARSIAGVLADDPAIRTAYGFGNFADTFVVRGFQLTTDDIQYNGLFGIAPRQLVAIEGLERVEVFRGASAFLNGVSPGGTGTGGMINLVPKYATAADITQATIDYTSDSQVGGHVDVGRRFGKNREFGVRVNAMARGGDTPVDNESRQQRLFTLGLDYQGDAFRVNADFGYQKQRINQGRSTVQLSGTALPAVPSASTNFAQPWTYSELEDTYGTIRAEYDVTRDWTTYAAFGAHHSNEFGNYSGANVGNNGFGTATRLTVPFKQDTYTGEVGVRGRFETGPVKHTVNLSWSGLEQEKSSAFQSSPAFPTNLYNAPTVPYPAAPTTGNHGRSERDGPGQHQRGVVLGHAVVPERPRAADRRRAPAGDEHPWLRNGHGRADGELQRVRHVADVRPGGQAAPERLAVLQLHRGSGAGRHRAVQHHQRRAGVRAGQVEAA